MRGIRPSRRCRRALLFLAFGVYGVALLAGPFLHHDYACHLKSRTHCTTCAFGLSAHGVEVRASSPTGQLVDAGGLPAGTTVDLESLVLARPRDRSPPA